MKRIYFAWAVDDNYTDLNGVHLSYPINVTACSRIDNLSIPPWVLGCGAALFKTRDEARRYAKEMRRNWKRAPGAPRMTQPKPVRVKVTVEAI